MACRFESILDRFPTRRIREVVENLEATSPDRWPCRATGNHDFPRVTSRRADGVRSDAYAKLLTALLFPLKDDARSYQGEELGPGQTQLPRESLKDSCGTFGWSAFKGRCRGPISWIAGKTSCGFAVAKPWFPIPPSHRPQAVDLQCTDP